MNKKKHASDRKKKISRRRSGPTTEKLTNRRGDGTRATDRREGTAFQKPATAAAAALVSDAPDRAGSRSRLVSRYYYYYYYDYHYYYYWVLVFFFNFFKLVERVRRFEDRKIKNVIYKIICTCSAAVFPATVTYT